MSGLAFFRPKGPPAHGLHAQGFEKALRHAVAREPLQLRSVGDIKVLLLNGDYLLAGLILLAPVGEVSRRHGSTHIANRQILLPQDYQPVLVRKGERPQDERINSTKHDRISTDAQRERDHRNGRKARILQETADSPANVFEECFHDGISDYRFPISDFQLLLSQR